jgi:uncharacterized membrane protein
MARDRSPDDGGRTLGPPALLAAGIALGVGMGGMLDGILLHQIFQLHNMVSARVPPTTLEAMHRNMFWDGVFHFAVWAVTLAGIVLLWRCARRFDLHAHRETLVGSALIGWGLFNLVEGLIDHHLLGLHHVVERLGVSVWDWAFLGSGLLLIGAGVALLRRRAPRARSRVVGQPQPSESR